MRREKLWQPLKESSVIGIVVAGMPALLFAGLTSVPRPWHLGAAAGRVQLWSFILLMALGGLAAARRWALMHDGGGRLIARASSLHWGALGASLLVLAWGPLVSPALTAFLAYTVVHAVLHVAHNGMVPRWCALNLEVSGDLLQHYSDIFGDKSVNGKTVQVEGLIASITRETREDYRHIRQQRHDFLHTEGDVRKRYSFLSPDLEVTDVDGNKLTVAQIRQGMLDNFFGNDSHSQWKLNEGVPIPAEVVRPGLQGTGPFDDMGMAMSAINAQTASWMPDWEDAGNDYGDQLYSAWKNLKELLAGDWEGRAFAHPVKKKDYQLRVKRESWPTLFIRVPGLHLKNRQMTLDGEPVPGTIPAVVIHALNNYDSQQRNQSGIYHYVPKIETPEEALLVGKILKSVEEAIGVARGTIKIEMLNERARYSAHQEAIMWVLRHWLVGPNVGRWDYINSRIEMGKDSPALVFPDPHTVGMTEPSMTAYTRRNALLTNLVEGFPVGGMAATMKNPKQPQEVNDNAVRSVFFDKLRERLTGLFVIEGKLYDSYRQSWVATTENEYARAGEKPLIAGFSLDGGSELQKVVGESTQDERTFLENLGLVKGGKINPCVVSTADLTVDNLFSDEAWNEVFNVPQGEVTEVGLRYALYMSSEYMFQQLNGNNAAAIDDYLSGMRLMNDFATYEIFWHWLWTVLHHQVELTQDGETTKKGDRVDETLISRLLDERWKTVEEFFADMDRQGIEGRFDRSKAPLVMDVLRRQLMHPDWIMYGSRVLLSIIESDEEKLQQVLSAVFSTSRESGELDPLVLAACNYVYDTNS